MVATLRAVSPACRTDWLGGPTFTDNPGVRPDRSYSITELLTAFRRALIALTPTADEDAYDEWDLIEDVLFDVDVASAVRGDVARFGSSQPFRGVWVRSRSVPPSELVRGAWLESAPAQTTTGVPAEDRASSDQVDGLAGL